jgi:hypothetical protein
MNAELQQYVREALARGLSRDEIRATLAGARWRAEEIDAELDRWADGPGGLPVPRRRLSLSSREAFMHLVMFATLYTFAFNVGAILFVLIARRFPDPAFQRSYDEGLRQLRGSIAGVLTAFPIFLWMAWLIGRSLVREAEKRSSGIRRWLTYLTLFIAVLVLIGNFVGVLTSLLSGALTVRVALQSAVVFAIAGLVFGHYLLGLRRDEAEAVTGPAGVGVLGRLGAIGTVAVVVAGLMSSGTPARVRRTAMDDRRVEALTQIAGAVDDHAREMGRLPDSLAEARPFSRPGDGFERNDPATGQPFEYMKVDSATYRLSATFDTADTLDSDGRPVPTEWRHASGPVTFTRHAPQRGPMLGPGLARRPRR